MQAILMLASEMNGLVLDRFEALNALTEFDKIVLCQDELGKYRPSRCLKTFSFANVRLIGYKPISTTIVPGSNHFPVIEFALTSDYDFVWSIEYDVFFNGHWKRFFDSQHSDADLLTAEVSRFQDSPRWTWWSSLVAPVPLGAQDMLRSFNPVYRLSKTAATYLRARYMDGWSGHHEVTMPTALNFGGFTVEDFGGRGGFVRKSNYGRWYNSHSYSHKPRYMGKLHEMPDMLVHPVKK